MGKLSKKDVEHVARLADLPLKASEIEKLSLQLSEIVSFVEELNKVETSGIEPTHQTTGLRDVTRTDEVKIANHLTQKQALSGSKKTYQGYFVVPAILEGRSKK